jgi:predicted permease
LVSLATGALFGLAPAIQATRPDLVSALKADVAGSEGRRRFPLRSALVVAEVAVCFVLLAGTGLLLRSLAAARGADVGFDPRGLVVTTVDLEMHRYSADRGRAFYHLALDRLQALPGVTGAALVERVPFSPNLHAQNIFIDGRAYTPGDRGTLTDVTRVTAGYFKAIGVRLLQGRDFDERDTVDSPGVVIVNDTMARRYWPGDTAIGKRVRVRASDGPVFEVIGVAADHKVRTVGEAPRPFLHFSRNQAYNASATLLARTTDNADILVQAVRQELIALEPNIVFLENQTMEASIATTLFPARIGTIVLSVAGGVALLLAAIGLYGLIAFSVSRRTREIGIRVALGANPASVLALVLRQGMALVLVGLVAGALVAVVATRALQGALYGIAPTDPVSFGGAVALLSVVALAANLVPAYRASRTDPMVALRNGVRS